MEYNLVDRTYMIYDIKSAREARIDQPGSGLTATGMARAERLIIIERLRLLNIGTSTHLYGIPQTCTIESGR